MGEYCVKSLVHLSLKDPVRPSCHVATRKGQKKKGRSHQNHTNGSSPLEKDGKQEMKDSLAWANHTNVTDPSSSGGVSSKGAVSPSCHAVMDRKQKKKVRRNEKAQDREYADSLSPLEKEDWEEEIKDLVSLANCTSPYDPDDVEAPKQPPYLVLPDHFYNPTMHHAPPVQWSYIAQKVESGQFADAEA